MDINIIKIIRFFLKQYKPQIISLSLLSLLVGGLEAVSVAAVYPMLNTAFASSSGTKNLIFNIFRNITSFLPIEDSFIGYCLVFLSIAVLAFITKLVFINARVKFSAWLVKTKQSEFFDKYMRADYKFFTDHKQGELIYDIAKAPVGLSTLIMSATELISEGVLALLLLLFLFSLSWKGAFIIIIAGILYQYGVRYFAKKVSYVSAKGEIEEIRKSKIILNEVINGIRQIKVFSLVNMWVDKFNNVIGRRWYYFKRRTRTLELPSPTLIFLVYFLIGVSAIIIKILFPGNFIALIPIFGTFVFAIFRLVPIASKMGALVLNLMGSLPNCEVCYSIINRQINDIKDGDIDLDVFSSDIEFKDVSFSYTGKKYILKDMSLRFDKGKTIVIVGRSGSGKTTIVNLLLRLYDADKGRVNIDGKNIKDYKLHTWMHKIGVVCQDAFALNDTVRNNITFGFDYSEKEIVEAAKYADAHSFIMSLPQRYNTIVGDKGMKLSGGQRQRIAVARAMIRKPEILIFDEATNALDNISQLAVQKAIERISKDHTAIIIAHRLSTIKNADKIIVLEDGYIKEEGTFKELMEKQGSYWRLYQSQPVEN